MLAALVVSCQTGNPAHTAVGIQEYTYEVPIRLGDGWGGQILVIYPELNCTAVMTGGNYRWDDAGAKWHDDYLAPALFGGLESQPTAIFR